MKLTKNNLSTAEAICSLGLVVIKELKENEVAIIFINSRGEVELCPPTEIRLDSLKESDALDILLEKKYSDEQLEAYLQGRASRLRFHHE